MKWCLREPLRKSSALVMMAVLVVSCTPAREAARNNPDTVYLTGNFGSRPERSAAASAPTGGTGARRATPTPAHTTGVVRSLSPANASVDDHLRARQAQLLKRVDDLTNEEADAVCLSMQLVARERIFDHSVRPKKILLRYTSEATSEAELDFLERVLNDRR